MNRAWVPRRTFSASREPLSLVSIVLGLGFILAVVAIGVHVLRRAHVPFAERQKGSPRRRLEFDRKDRSPRHISRRPDPSQHDNWLQRSPEDPRRPSAALYPGH